MENLKTKVTVAHNKNGNISVDQVKVAGNDKFRDVVDRILGEDDAVEILSVEDDK